MTDAAQNTSTVLDQTITTVHAGAGTVSTLVARRHHVRAKLVIVWRTAAYTRAYSARARNRLRSGLGLASLGSGSTVRG
ncbi:MAG: hypothetical protein M3071_13340 [Actinomycetota bacterium]|nr:hypothetical protein [Actinomycetota bacterium]